MVKDQQTAHPQPNRQPNRPFYRGVSEIGLGSGLCLEVLTIVNQQIDAIGEPNDLRVSRVPAAWSTMFGFAPPMIPTDRFTSTVLHRVVSCRRLVSASTFCESWHAGWVGTSPTATKTAPAPFNSAGARHHLVSTSECTHWSLGWREFSHAPKANVAVARNAIAVKVAIVIP